MADREAWTEWAKAGGVTVRVRVPPPRTKYGNTLVIVDGLAFDSKREAARYVDLKRLQQAGQIAHLETQPAFPLIVGRLRTEGPPTVFLTVGQYHADFRYLDLGTGEVMVEDVKSKPTKNTAYQLRKKLVEAIHGIVITEVR